MSKAIQSVKKKNEKQSLDQLLDQIARLKEAISTIQSGYIFYRQLRNQSLGKHLQTYRQLLLDQLKSLDYLSQNPFATKANKKTIAEEFTTIVNDFESYFTWTFEEIEEWHTIIYYYSGIQINPVFEIQEIEESSEAETTKSKEVKSIDKKTIREIYKSLMKHFHPDLNKSEKSMEIAQNITTYYENGDLENLLQLYQQTFQKLDDFSADKNLRKQLEEELELLNIRFEEMVKDLGSDQKMTEKSAVKRVKKEAKNFRDFLAYQTEILQNIYCDLDNFIAFDKQRE